MKPSILHVFPSFSGGGPEVRTAELINRTSDCFQHAVISINGDLSGTGRLLPDIEVPCSTIEASTIGELRKTIKQHRSDAVFTYGWGGVDAIVAARLAGFRRVVHMEDGFLADERDKQKRARLVARRLAFKLARTIVVPSQNLEDIARREWKVPRRRLLFIANGIDGQRFQPCCCPQRKAAIRNKLDVPPERIVVGTVGALRPEKNQLRLVRVFAGVARRFEKTHLLIVGDGPLAEPMRAEARRHGILDHVTFCGKTPDPADHYRAMDLFALSSDTEQMPLAVLEAMATALPVVSTDVGDVVRMVADENNKHVVDVDDERAFSSSLGLLVTDSGVRDLLGKANRLRFDKHYSLKRMLAAYQDLYASATRN